jgi:hypothetical protein
MRIILSRKQSGMSFITFTFFALLAMSAYYSYTVRQTSMVWFGLGACALSFLGTMFSANRSDLILMIDDTGVLDRRLGFGKIHWSDVEDVQLQVTPTNRYLSLKVANPDYYLSKLRGRRKEEMIYSRSLGFQNFNIDIGALDVNLLELKKLIDRRVRGTTRGW